MIEADTSNFPTQTQYNTHMYESVQKKAKDNFDDIKKICQESGQQMRSVPQVLIDGKLIGGFEEIEEWCKITFEG
jgi:glutaredoxin